jgi:hypothetical protein
MRDAPKNVEFLRGEESHVGGVPDRGEERTFRAMVLVYGVSIR